MKDKKLKCELYNDSMQEKWVDVAGYEGLYQVSNLGNVRSVSHYARNNMNGGNRFTEGRTLCKYKMPNGYLQVQLSKSDKREKCYVHRLVAKAFLENGKNLSDVNHKDGDKNNNSVSNLEWVSHRDNQIHMVKNRMTRKMKPVLCVETQTEYPSVTDAQRESGCDRHFIKKCCESGEEYKGKHWRWIK